MSSFLGPIHFWLYNKINLQEELARDIASAAKGRGFISDEGEYISEPLPELSGAIDLGNIHGWLQEKISESESRLAKLVTDIVREDDVRISFVTDTASSFGKRHPVSVQADAQDAHKALNDTLVNGMPCDMVEDILESSPERVVWKRVADVHAEYWNAIGGNSTYYWKIRSAIIRGMLAGTGLEFLEKDDGIFEIKKKA